MQSVLEFTMCQGLRIKHFTCSVLPPPIPRPTYFCNRGAFLAFEEPREPAVALPSWCSGYSAGKDHQPPRTYA